MYSSGLFFVCLFSSALVFALINRLLRHLWLAAGAFRQPVQSGRDAAAVG